MCKEKERKKVFFLTCAGKNKISTKSKNSFVHLPEETQLCLVVMFLPQFLLYVFFFGTNSTIQAFKLP